ncbi:helix-turn-helix transcriptional regulator [bacterium]|nr:helix-turn-helix transcriptional regulator [bacterium]
MLTLLSPFVAKRRQLSGTLAERVGALLDEKGKTITWLAEQSGLHRVVLSRVVNGRTTDVHLSTLQALARALDVPVGDLVDDLPDARASGP